MQERDYQTKIITDVFDAYDRGIQSGIINLHVGGGKTYIAARLAREMRKRHPDKKTAFFVDRKELAWQAQKAFQRDDPTLKVGVEMAENHANPKCDIVIFSIATIGRKGSFRIGKWKTDAFSLLISDECHLSTAPIWLRALHYFGVTKDNFHDGKLLVGLTGTAFRNDGVSLGTLYDDIFAQRTIAEGIKDGWLTDIEYIQIQTGTDISNVHTRAGEFVQLELLNAIDNPYRNGQIIKAYQDYCKGTALVFAGSVEHAYKLAEMFNEIGIKAKCIEGGTDEIERKEAIDLFRNEEGYQVFTNYNVFSVGVDFPELDAIILARPIKSTVLYTQIVGRVLRTSATALVDLAENAEQRRQWIDESDKPTGKVIDFMDNVGNHNVCTLPVLFGLNPKVKTDKKKFHEEVVEVVEAIKRETGADIRDIVDPDTITLKVNRSRMQLKQYSPDEYITKLSSNLWLSTGDDEYELNLQKSKLSLIIKRNMIDKYDIYIYHHDTSLQQQLNTLNSLAGAIKVCDELIVEKQWDTQFAKQEAWQGDPPTQKQVATLYKMFKSKGMVFTGGRYSNNVNRFMLWGTPINTKGEAAAILTNTWKKK
jgi:superfamily II DNA or RNA helicase